MIVKNESAVIERCLASVRPFIGAWAISDTGSTDGTQDLVRRAMDGIPGELIERPWVDFATNRNEALELARNYGDFALVIDADEVFEADPDFRYPPLDAPGYRLELRYGRMTYQRAALVRTDLDWVWRGVLHEALVSRYQGHVPLLHGLAIRVNTDGARSQVNAREKYRRDADVLRKALEAEPGNTRYTFYLAQSLRDAGDLAESLAVYEKRVAMGGWIEEVFYAKLQIALLKERLHAAPADISLAYLEAFDHHSRRAETACEFARWNRLNRRFAVAREFARIAVNTPLPHDVLFIDRTVYDWRARDELAIALYWCGQFRESLNVCRDLLADNRLPAAERPRIQRNLEFALAKCPAEVGQDKPAIPHLEGYARPNTAVP